MKKIQTYKVGQSEDSMQCILRVFAKFAKQPNGNPWKHVIHQWGWTQVLPWQLCHQGARGIGGHMPAHATRFFWGKYRILLMPLRELPK